MKLTKESGWESMLDMFIFETLQLIGEMEQSVLNIEKSSGFKTSINEIFRVMHTIKSSAAMMLFDNIATLAHSIEDLFYYLREEKPQQVDYASLTDIVLAGIDFIKGEINYIERGEKAEGDASGLIDLSKQYLISLKALQPVEPYSQPVDLVEELSPSEELTFTRSGDTAEGNRYHATIFFEDNCEMENVRAYLVLRNLEQMASIIEYCPPDIIDNEATVSLIRQDGFQVLFTTELKIEELESQLLKTAFIKEIQFDTLGNEDVYPVESSEEMLKSSPEIALTPFGEAREPDISITTRKPTLISVNISKLDSLMDLVGELVISEAMVSQNPELADLNLDGFRKATRQLTKITHELQDVVMSIRMVSLSLTFQKMHRVVRDMSHKLSKAVQLEIIGEETEVDKNIIEQISDPIMHLIRNAIDHGIETPEERRIAQKDGIGKITLEARNSGGEVWITIKDDGKGLDRDKILQRAREHGLVNNSEPALSDQEIYSYILLPGFSTKEQVSEFSGRGVGMDVVMKNIEKVGGSVLVDSSPGIGTTVSLKIPLTLAIIDGMVIKVGDARFTIPMTSIKESFKIWGENIIIDPEGNEMILIRGECYSIIRLHEFCHLSTNVTRIQDGIIIMVENESNRACLFADALLGEQQVVIKSLPEYVKRLRCKAKGLGGCTLLGDGSISLILDVAGLLARC
ncbi:MAG: chemotaxis protein CheA [Firmicutes bacterium HGW-Firmicutes-15]|nr:MAG: chemotaxis protein CheA [Firmicutes bacterium HGW-Firmicutes-15]